MRAEFHFFWIWLAIGLAGSAFAFYGCVMPNPPGPHLHNIDKIEHLTTFLFLGAGWAALLAPRYLLVFAALAFFGGAIEVIQPYVGRDGDVVDWLFDVIGVAAGIVAAYLFAADWLRMIDRRVAASTHRAG